MPVTLEQGRGRGAVRACGRSLSSPAVMRRGRSERPAKEYPQLVIVEDEMPMEESYEDVPQQVRRPVEMVRLGGMEQPTWEPPQPVWAEPVRMPCQCPSCVPPMPMPPMPVQHGDWNAMFQIPPWAHAGQAPWSHGYPEGMVPDPIFKKRRRRGRRGRGGRGKKAAQEAEAEEEHGMDEGSSDSQ
eukprot:TRINITY_DN1850_c4_g1_i1.p1 TRINITY_DN1850_c4_g1~~TRINITY_DN1850_c4_g1_i1.p1  ORF type:complete len:185 (+),score=39.53 TRINITY_DN1850_c4_g1_i1:65-619(+)